MRKSQKILLVVLAIFLVTIWISEWLTEINEIKYSIIASIVIILVALFSIVVARIKNR